MPARPSEPPADPGEPPYDAAKQEVLRNLDPEDRQRLLDIARTAAADAPPPDPKTAAALRRLLLRTWLRPPR
jgi:hypothetical protein